jgi:hypothetical protein
VIQKEALKVKWILKKGNLQEKAQEKKPKPGPLKNGNKSASSREPLTNYTMPLQDLKCAATKRASQ